MIETAPPSFQVLPLPLLLSLALSAPPSADAVRAYTEGVRQAREGDPWAARLSFGKAIALNPGDARARYARAAAEAPEFGNSGCLGSKGMGEPRCAPPSTLVDDLTWLRERAATDAEAKKLLAALATDPAFDSVTNGPEVRAALGWPAVATLKPADRLLERAGRWFSFGMDCSFPELTLAFAAKGRVRLQVFHRCSLDPAAKPLLTTGTWSLLPDGRVELAFKWHETAPSDELWLPARTTIEFDAERQRFHLEGTPAAGRKFLGDFSNSLRK
ncbi:MAG: hypothetical protein Q8K32_08060 [Archangium sp.]|nr:hypothetical protein [Archangium sp.]